MNVIDSPSRALLVEGGRELQEKRCWRKCTHKILHTLRPSTEAMNPGSDPVVDLEYFQASIRNSSLGA